MITLDWPQVHAWRLARHYLLEPAPRARLLDVVADLAGVQAQVLSAAEQALGARVANVTPQDVRAALWKERTLVKTWAMRGTLHLFSAAQLPLVTAALRTRRHYLNPTWLKYNGLTAADVVALIDATRTALDGRCLTREQLTDAIIAQTGTHHLGELLRSGWGLLLKPAAYHGYLCFGPNQGSAVTFVRPDQWLSAWHEVDSTTAMDAILRAFLTSYGPATRAEFARWWGVQPPEVKGVFARLAGELEEVTVEGKKAWMLREQVAELRDLLAAQTVRLLPNFDPYVLGFYRQSPQVLDAAHKTSIYRAAGWVSPVVLVDGRIEGVWQYERQRGQIRVRVEMFTPPETALQSQIAVEAERLGAFLGGPVVLEYLAPGVQLYPAKGAVAADEDDAA
jgi:hypothetical protein